MSRIKDDLRKVMRSWTSGVTVVTARHGDQQHGMTVSSFTSIDLEPPRVLVSLERSCRTHELASLSGHFGITILSAGQKDISDRFAGRMPELDNNRFEGLAVMTLKSGSPFIAGGLACLDCAIIHSYGSGSNTLLIGDVIAASSSGEGDPLLYFDRDYRALK
jgi:flavin reductase (DIM6/NTAB) family NADH-FMN oxidoreductase RutF